jgi:hypothetical protein
MLRAALVRRRRSSLHRVFANAAWSLDRLGLARFDALKPWLGEDVVFLALDDALARKRGMKVLGAGMHLDPIVGARNNPADASGTRSGRAANPSRVPTSAGPLVLSADPRSALSQLEVRRARSHASPHAARAGRRDAPRACRTKEIQAVAAPNARTLLETPENIVQAAA